MYATHHFVKQDLQPQNCLEVPDELQREGPMTTHDWNILMQACRDQTNPERLKFKSFKKIPGYNDKQAHFNNINSYFENEVKSLFKDVIPQVSKQLLSFWHESSIFLEQAFWYERDLYLVFWGFNKVELATQLRLVTFNENMRPVIVHEANVQESFVKPEMNFKFKFNSLFFSGKLHYFEVNEYTIQLLKYDLKSKETFILKEVLNEAKVLCITFLEDQMQLFTEVPDKDVIKYMVVDVYDEYHNSSFRVLGQFRKKLQERDIYVGKWAVHLHNGKNIILWNKVTNQEEGNQSYFTAKMEHFHMKIEATAQSFEAELTLLNKSQMAFDDEEAFIELDQTTNNSKATSLRDPKKKHFLS